MDERRRDWVVDARAILEYKTLLRAVDVGEAQVLNYLRCTDKEVGLLMNFLEKPSFKRYFMSNDNKKDRRRPRSPHRPIIPRSCA
jgi:GxxExxY protein